MKPYAPHSTVNELDIPGDRVWCVDIRGNLAALKAYGRSTVPPAETVSLVC